MLKIGVGVFLVSIIVSVWYLFWMPIWWKPMVINWYGLQEYGRLSANIQ